MVNFRLHLYTGRIVIYAVDKAIHSLNSRGQLFIAT